MARVIIKIKGSSTGAKVWTIRVACELSSYGFPIFLKVCDRHLRFEKNTRRFQRTQPQRGGRCVEIPYPPRVSAPAGRKVYPLKIVQSLVPEAHRTE